MRLTRAQSRERTRALLLESAVQLFRDHGVNGTSVEQIAENAGFSRGAFYGNFSGKAEIVRALLQLRTLQELAEVRRFQETDAEGDASPIDRLREWNRARGVNSDEWLALRLELVLFALRNPAERDAVAETERIALDAITSSVRSQLERKDSPLAADYELLGLIVRALEDGLLIQRLFFPEQIRPEVVVDAYELLRRMWSVRDVP